MKAPATKLSRRQFLSITASAGLLLAGGLGVASRSKAQAAEAFRDSRLVMGSIANLTIISTDAAQARAAISAAFDRMQGLEAVLSRFREQSQLSQLNTVGWLTDAHPALVEVLTRAVAYGHLTGGAFDVSIEPVHKLYREQALLGKLPTHNDVEAARQYVNYRAIEINPGSVRFKQAGMAVTLDGIGKGYIIDQGAAVLREYGFDNVLVEIGGDMNALGQPAERPWQISIEQPDTALAQQPLIAHLSSIALATSGDYLNSFTVDHRLNHILDPQSGISPLELASASVIAPTACDADALATALIVMGKARGLELAEQLEDVEALVIAKKGAIHQTADFPLHRA